MTEIILLSLSLVSIIAASFVILQKLDAMQEKLPKDNSEILLAKFEAGMQAIDKAIEKLDSLMREESARGREEFAQSFTKNREELSGQLKISRDEHNLASKNLSDTMRNSLTEYRQDFARMREVIESSIKNLQEDNAKKLDEMRSTVDEKLQSTLEKRLKLSFDQVTERLEMVHKGLGEMQNLAVGVGDLKKVLTNVKTRGTWGEIQLKSLLEQMLSVEQFEENVAVKPKTQERVDFAIKLPGDNATSDPVWLPIDSKFPQEDYQRLVEAHDKADIEMAEQAAKQLENRIKLEAKSIKDKYIDPPMTTDFALMFLPTEGLYAEIVQNPGLVDKLQREHRVVVVGPNTLAALLNSLQMGFRTLTIQKQSSEVWKYLSEVKKHFGSFGDLLAKAYEKVQQASKVIEDAGKRSRTIETKLRKVSEIELDSLNPEQGEGSLETANLN